MPAPIRAVAVESAETTQRQQNEERNRSAICCRQKGRDVAQQLHQNQKGQLLNQLTLLIIKGLSHSEQPLPDHLARGTGFSYFVAAILTAPAQSHLALLTLPSLAALLKSSQRAARFESCPSKKLRGCPIRNNPLLIIWRAVQDSNLWPLAPEANALSN